MLLPLLKKTHYLTNKTHLFFLDFFHSGQFLKSCGINFRKWMQNWMLLLLSCERCLGMNGRNRTPLTLSLRSGLKIIIVAIIISVITIIANNFPFLTLCLSKRIKKNRCLKYLVNKIFKIIIN